MAGTHCRVFRYFCEAGPVPFPASTPISPPLGPPALVGRPPCSHFGSGPLAGAPPLLGAGRDPLLRLLNGLFSDSGRANSLYPGLLMARQIALGLQGLPVDPDQA